MRKDRWVVKELQKLGVTNWTIETGKKHQILRIDGRVVTVLPHGRGNRLGFAERNVVAAIKRAVREAH